ncbi:hypothetical protein D3C80_1962460 [compost metagenome]
MAVVQRPHQPDLTFATVYAVGLGLVGIAQGWQAIAPLHQQACTLLPSGGGLKDLQRGNRVGWQAHRNSSRP